MVGERVHLNSMATAELTDFGTVSVRNVGFGQTEESFPFDEGPSA